MCFPLAEGASRALLPLSEVGAFCPTGEDAWLGVAAGLAGLAGAEAEGEAVSNDGEGDGAGDSDE